jgi:hypothetical protein
MAADLVGTCATYGWTIEQRSAYTLAHPNDTKNPYNKFVYQKGPRDPFKSDPKFIHLPGPDLNAMDQPVQDLSNAEQPDLSNAEQPVQDLSNALERIDKNGRPY